MAKAKETQPLNKLRVDMKEWETEDSLLLLRGWARDGLTDEQIAQKIGISRGTLIAWKRKSAILLNALKKTKEMANREVEEMLFKRAMGFYVEEEVTETRMNGDQEELTLKRKTKKFIPPSETAMIYWLKNRMKEIYRDNPRSKKDDAEQDARIAKLKKEAKDDNANNEIKVVIEGGEAYAE